MESSSSALTSEKSPTCERSSTSSLGWKTVSCEFVWQAKKGGGSDNRGVVSEHEYVLCYCRNIDAEPLGQLTIDAEPLDQERTLMDPIAVAAS